MKRLTVVLLAVISAGCPNSPPASGDTDKTKPEILLLTVRPSRVAAGFEVQVSFDVSEATKKVEVWVAGGTASCTGTSAFQCVYRIVGDEGDGEQPVVVHATDLAGNVGEAGATIVVDTTAPLLSLTKVPPPLSNQSGGTVEFSADEQATFTCAVDAAGPLPCTSPYAYSGLAEGDHVIRVTADDDLGNQSSASASFTVDLTPPDTFIDPPLPAFTDSATLDAAFQAEEDATFECRLDQDPFAPCASPVHLAGYSEGPHRFEVRASDLAGNVEPEPAAADFVFEIAAPVVTITSQPADFTRDRDATISFTGNKAGMTFTCSLDGAAAAACTSPLCFLGLADGPHAVEIVGTDGIGHVSQPATASWTVDNDPPTTTIASIADTGLPSRSITFAADEAGCTFECALDSAAFAACTSPASLAGLADGSHAFSVRATDRAGNVEAPAAGASLVVDTEGPATTILSGPTGTVFVATASFTFQADQAGSTFECRLDAAAFATCASPADVTVSSDGDHAFEVRATDVYGNTGPAARRTWTADAFPPTVTITAKPASPTKATKADISFTSNKADATFACSLDGGSATGCVSPKSYAGLADGPHVFEVVATDAASRQSAPAQASWTVDTKAPSTSITSSPPPLSNQTSVSFSFTASETGSTFECSLDGSPFAPCTSPDGFSIGEGLHTFAVRAVDPAGNTGTSATYTFEIDLTPPAAPAIDQPDPSLVTNTTPTFSWSASATAITYSFQLATTSDFGQLVQSATGSAALFYAATVLPSSRYYFRANARDAAGNDSAWSKTGVLEVRTWGFFNPEPQGATMLRVSCLDAQTCWFVGEAGLATRTLDAGATFRQASTGVTGSLTGLHVLDSTTAVACGHGGAILRTTDGGVTWFSVVSGVTADLYAVRFSGAVGYAVGDNGTVLRSADSGSTWTRLSAPTAASLRDLAILDPGAATTVVAVGGTGVAVRSQDGGSSWTLGASGTTAMLRAVSFVDTLNGYAVGAYSSSGKNMRKTVDGGKTWTEVLTGTTKELYGVLFVDALHGWTLGDSDNSVASLRSTSDGGATWTGDGVYPLANRPVLRAMSFDPATGAGMAAGDGGVVLRTADSWATYLPAIGVTGTLPTKTDDQEIRVTRFVSPTVGWLFGNGGYAMKTTDRGDTLAPLDATVFTSAKHVYAASFVGATWGWAGGDANFMARTVDGTTWTKVTPPVSIYVRGMHFPTTDFGVVVGTSGKILQWDGTALTQATSPVTASLRAVSMVDATHGFIVGDGGVVLVNSGAGWVTETSGVTSNLWGVWAVDATTAFAVGDGGRLLKRTVMGWASPSSGTAATLKDVAFASAQTGWIVGDGTILVTSDGGTTWKKQVSPTGSTLQSVSPASSDAVFAVGSARNAIRTSLGGR